MQPKAEFNGINKLLKYINRNSRKIAFNFINSALLFNMQRCQISTAPLKTKDCLLWHCAHSLKTQIVKYIYYYYNII